MKLVLRGGQGDWQDELLTERRAVPLGRPPQHLARGTPDPVLGIHKLHRGTPSGGRTFNPATRTSSSLPGRAIRASVRCRTLTTAVRDISPQSRPAASAVAGCRCEMGGGRERAGRGELPATALPRTSTPYAEAGVVEDVDQGLGESVERHHGVVAGRLRRVGEVRGDLGQALDRSHRDRGIGIAREEAQCRENVRDRRVHTAVLERGSHAGQRRGPAKGGR